MSTRRKPKKITPKKKALPAAAAAAPAAPDTVEIGGSSLRIKLTGESARRWGGRLMIAIGVLVILALAIWLALGLPWQLLGKQQEGIDKVKGVQKEVSLLKEDLTTFKDDQEAQHEEVVEAIEALTTAVDHLSAQNSELSEIRPDQLSKGRD